MPVIRFSCPSCGAAMDYKEAGDACLCMSCGMTSTYDREGDDFEFYVVNVEVTNHNHIENATIIATGPQGPDLGNLVTLMKQAYRAGNYSECFDIASQVLIQDPKHAYAWFYKGLAAGYSSRLAHFRSKEVITCYRNAMKYATPKEKEGLKGQAQLLVDLAESFVSQSRDHAMEFNTVESAHDDHIRDVKQACTLALDIYRESGSKGALKAIVNMCGVYDEMKATRRETLKILEDLDPKFVQQQKDQKTSENVGACGCGVLILLILGGVLYFILR